MREAGHQFLKPWRPEAAISPRTAMNNIQSPRTDDQGIEAEIVAKGKTAARITPSALQANIDSFWFFTAAEGVEGAAAAGTPYAEQPPVSAASPLRLLTFCVLVLKNGFTVTGESACASPENFDAEIGKKIARQNAEQKIWPLMGYALKQSLHDAAAVDGAFIASEG